MRADIKHGLGFMTYAPTIFISALTGQRVGRLFELINFVYGQSCMRISTSMLNSVLAEATTRVQPPTDRGKRLKLFYMTQTGIKPPNFVIFVNDAGLFHYSYQRYIENQIRSVFGLEGTCQNSAEAKGRHIDKRFFENLIPLNTNIQIYALSPGSFA